MDKNDKMQRQSEKKIRLVKIIQSIYEKQASWIKKLQKKLCTHTIHASFSLIKEL